MTIALVLLVVGGFWVLLFGCAVYALPVYVGLAAGLSASGTGSSVLGALLIGIGAGALSLLAGRAIFALVRRSALRVLVALIFAAPAAVAAYSIVEQLCEITMPPTFWRFVFGAVAAMAAGSTAIARLTQRPAADLRGVRLCIGDHR